MLLAVDVGNTDTVFGFYSYQSENWLAPLRTRSLAEEPAAHYENKLRLHLLETGISFNNVETVVLSCVVPALLPTLRAMLTHLFGKAPTVVGPDVYPDLTVQIDHPHEIGSDLVANAVAAFVKYGRNAVVVDFGTA